MSVTPMRYPASAWWLAMMLVLHACVGFAGEPDLLDDRDIPLGSRRELRALRTRLIQYIWGQPELPRDRVPDTVTTNVPSPVRHLRGLARVDRYRTTLAEDLEGLAYHFIPEFPIGRSRKSSCRRCEDDAELAPRCILGNRGRD